MVVTEGIGVGRSPGELTQSREKVKDNESIHPWSSLRSSGIPICSISGDAWKSGKRDRLNQKIAVVGLDSVSEIRSDDIIIVGRGYKRAAVNNINV